MNAEQHPNLASSIRNLHLAFCIVHHPRSIPTFQRANVQTFKRVHVQTPPRSNASPFHRHLILEKKKIQKSNEEQIRNPPYMSDFAHLPPHIRFQWQEPAYLNLHHSDLFQINYAPTDL
jgi:hypothetical protein